MATRTLLLIITKVLGLFFLRDALPLLSQPFGLLAMMRNSGEVELGYIIFSIIPVLIYGAVAFALLFKTEWMLEILHLEQGLNEHTEMEFHPPTLLQISALVVGGLMVLTAVPPLLRQLYLHLQYASASRNRLLDTPGMPDKTMLAVYGAEIVIGLLLLNNYRKVAAYIYWKTRS